MSSRKHRGEYLQPFESGFLNMIPITQTNKITVKFESTKIEWWIMIF